MYIGNFRSNSVSDKAATEVTITNVSETEREMEIAVAAEELLPRFEQAYREYQPKVTLRGFRKGKVPLELVKRLYGESIEHEVLEELAEEFYRGALEERKVKPIGTPVLVDLKYERGSSARFKIRYEVEPEFELAGYKGLRVEKPIHRVTQEEIEGEILRLRRAHAITTPAEQVLDDQYIVTVDIQELDRTGFPIIGKKDENVRFYLGSEEINPEIRDALTAAKPGEERRVTLKESRGDHIVETNLLLKVNAVAKFELPPFDDAFVQKITEGRKTNTKELTDSIREELVAYWEREAERAVDDAIVGEIVRRHDFQPPESLVERFLDSYLEEYKNRQRGKKLPSDFDEEKFRSDLRPTAIFQAKWYLIRKRIIEAEGLTVEDEDLKSLAERESARIGVERDRLIQFYKTSEQTKERILGEKLMAFLRAQSNIVEVEARNTPSLNL